MNFITPCNGRIPSMSTCFRDAVEKTPYKRSVEIVRGKQCASRTASISIFISSLTQPGHPRAFACLSGLEVFHKDIDYYKGRIKCLRYKHNKLRLKRRTVRCTSAILNSYIQTGTAFNNRTEVCGLDSSVSV